MQIILKYGIWVHQKIIFILENITNMYWCPVYFDLFKWIDNSVIHGGKRYRRKIQLIGLDVDLKVPAELPQGTV